MDDKEPRAFRITRRSLLGSGTFTAAFLLGGFPQITRAAKFFDAEAAATPISVELRINGQGHLLKLDPRTTLLDALREHLALTGSKKGWITASAALARCCWKAAASTLA